MNTKTQTLLRQAIVKAKSQLPIDALIDQVKDTLSTTWKTAARDVMISVLADLEDTRKPAPQTWEDWQRYEDRISEALGAEYATKAIDPLIETTEAAYLMGMKAGAKGSGVSVMWNTPDLKSLDILGRNTRFWVGSYFGDNLQEALKAVMQDYFDGGYTRADLSVMLRTHLSGLPEKSGPYWNLLADHLATKTREIGRVSGYEQAGIERVIWRSHLDSRTTAICRRMHNTVIEVKYLRKGVDKYLSACESNDKDKIKKSWKWWADQDVEKKLTSPQAIQKQIRSGNIFMPPAHGCCRSITVSEFSNE